ncbi:MAG: hypothetical protein R3F37_02970 [Candidatus Competibacteraceae bacterium]
MANKECPSVGQRDPDNPSSSEINTDQVAALNDNPETSTLDNDGLGEDRLEFLRGNWTKEGEDVGDFRERGSILGDIIHSDPRFVGPPRRLFPDSMETQPYSAFDPLTLTEGRCCSREPTTVVYTASTLKPAKN